MERGGAGAVRFSKKAVRVFPALSLRRVRPSYGTFFVMVFQGNCSWGRTDHTITCTIVLTTETNILEHDDSSPQLHDWLLFSVDKFHYLNAAQVGSSSANNDFDCTFKCLRNPFCLSINLAASKDANGKLWCELLSSNRHRNPLDYRENKTSHHLFVRVGSFFDTAILLVKNSGCCTAEPSKIIE